MQQHSASKQFDRYKANHLPDEHVRNGSAKAKATTKSPLPHPNIVPKPILRTSVVSTDKFAADADVHHSERLELPTPCDPDNNQNVQNRNDAYNMVNGTKEIHDDSFRNVSTRISPNNHVFVSPLTPLSTMTASNSFSWSRERALEQQIENLRETLKDTEERLQSLRLQYDNVSQMHRTLRDTNNHMHEEMDRLKIDAQHLRECANILRTELQAARKDRAEAVEVQKLLQRELDDSRAEKRKACDEADTNARQILDLQRQCKEMERIMARKNPDAMGGLLGAI